MYLPLFFNADLTNCLVIGGGDVALRKIEVLLKAGCNLLVISPRTVAGISELIRDGKVAHLRRKYEYGDCMGNQLIISATSDSEVNTQVSEEARALGIPVNVVDEPDLCSVIFPAIERDEPLTIAVSTGGRAPFMAAELRDRLRGTVKGWGRWVEIAGEFRESVRKAVTEPAERGGLYRRFVAAGMPPDEVAPPEDPDLDRWMDWLQRLEDMNR
ncbi:MAG TPA: bifunctional precorrin-2 dehydrogenase/sirohydrochlorin ferrochelatase [Bacteroidetes bacterium]|nr:bifunctional precorrin-2 dehydrogenase/sirohydrochlorin ferrochelatase [Bacteroidota bacterium]